MLGQCPQGDRIRLERFAINMMDSAKADNDGYIPNEETIYALQPLALQTPLPVKELVRLCTDNVQPVQISNSAGFYVCNRVYYESLYGKQKALFLHIPQNMPINIAVNTLNAIFEYITIPSL
jgi:pyroglutamyl-peptidase